MGLILALCAVESVFCHDFSYKQDTIYMLDDSDFRVKDGDVIIFLDRFRANNKDLLKTEHSNVAIGDNISFYHYMRSDAKMRHSDLLRVRSRTGGYFTRVKARKDGDRFVLLSKGGKFKAPKNCYIVISASKQKTLATKSSAVVIDLNDEIDFENLSVNPLTDAYFGCFGNQRYIF